MPLVPWIIGLVLFILTLLIPKALRLVYLVWMRTWEYLGWFNTRLILTLVFAVMFISFVLFMKIIRRDIMARKYDPKVESYRKISVSMSPKAMERPF